MDDGLREYLPGLAEELRAGIRDARPAVLRGLRGTGHPPGCPCAARLEDAVNGLTAMGDEELAAWAGRWLREAGLRHWLHHLAAAGPGCAGRPGND